MQTQELADRLKKNSSGEIYTDLATRGRYATDSSIYQTIPYAVFIPKSADDIAAALSIAKELEMPVLPRGSASSQNGQTTGIGLVIDNTPYFRNMLALNLEEGYVDVEPGIVLDHLNAKLKEHQVWYPVDVSTSAVASIGGMTGNNSCGSRSIVYGNMVHNVLGIDAWLADGTVESFLPMQYAKGRALELGQLIQNLAQTYQAEIDLMWPKVLRRVAGYNLDIFHNQNVRPYTNNEQVNLAHILVGSEGTLAYFKKLRLKLSPLPVHKTLGVITFNRFHDAMACTQEIIRLQPSAVEMVDPTMLEFARKNPLFKKTIDSLFTASRPPGAILLVEFLGMELDPLKQKLKDLNQLMSDLGHPESVTTMIDPAQQKELWDIRKAGLNIIMSMKGDGKPIAFIEDCAVPVEHLADYTQALSEVFHKNGTRGFWYAHASVGTLHIRPILNMHTDGAVKMRAIAEEAAELVKKFKGAYSGEHGDGISRGEWIAWQFGPKINEAFAQIKQAFDPDNLFSPGKIINPPKMDDQNLFRYGPNYKIIPLKPTLDWSSWNVHNDSMTGETTKPGTGNDPTHGFAKAVEMCNNNGHCRKFDAGTMCPSYRVTRNEKHLTRGRANTFRLALSGQLENTSVLHEAVKDALDLCVSCKGCKRECPTGVDMAKMKLEFMNLYKKEKGFTIRDRLIGHLPDYSSLIAKVPGLPALLNLRNHSSLIAKCMEWISGLSASRKFPTWTKNTAWQLTKGLASMEELKQAAKPVVLFVDTFNGYFESSNVLAAVKVLQAAGYTVHIPQKNSGHFCCGRTYISTGMYAKARIKAQELVSLLSSFTELGIPIVGLEPSCVLSLRDEYLVMGLGEQATKVAENTLMFEEFLAKQLADDTFKLNLKEAKKPILVHGHCHQKAFDVVNPIIRILQLIPKSQVQLIESSCCGMAGSFGYEAEHVSISKQMAELQLLPAIRNAKDAIIVADGTSCRNQIHEGTDRQALHVAQVLAMHL